MLLFHSMKAANMSGHMAREGYKSSLTLIVCNYRV